MKFRWYPKELRFQLVISFFLIVLLTAAAIGIPAIWVISQQLNDQAWSQVGQGFQASQALYNAKQNELENFATLTAQRPTLRTLLEMDDRQELEEYLTNLQTGAEIDAIIICDEHDKPIGFSGGLDPATGCSWVNDGGSHSTNSSGTVQVWLAAVDSIPQDDSTPTTVMVGVNLDEQFAEDMRSQTGLDHTILFESIPVASSLTEKITFTLDKAQPTSENDPLAEYLTSVQEVNGVRYYSTLAPVDEGHIQFAVSLDATAVAAIQKQLVIILISSLVVIAMLGSVVGVIIARRISSPLEQLANTATTFSRGNLKHPVSIDERVLEVAQVAQALENARVDLQNMLSVLQSEKDWTDHLLGSIVEGIITLDKGHKITFFSPGAERITGWTSEKVLGAHIDDVFGLAQSRVPFSGHIPPAGEKRNLDVTMADNRQANLAITRAQIAPPTAEKVLIALVFRDVSGEQAMHRLLGQFLANIAHEFRTPLSALGAAIELLMDQAADLTESELKELLNSLHLGALGLQNLVDNLLESASIEAGRFHISPKRNNISEIVSEAVTIMRPLAEKYGQRLTIDMPLAVPTVHADFRRTMQVLVNLISNASKYGPPDAPIKISVIPEPEWVQVQVADCGPGIPTSKKDMVFQRFLYPQDLDDSAKSGAGLGLSVVKAIIEAHGGKVGVEDRKDGGAIFWFTLPRVNKGEGA